MDEKGANIDLVFRNGLKDYEVLPPPEVWDHIQPAIKVAPPRYIFLKVAAAVTALATISFFAYRISREVVIFPEFNTVALNVEAATPVISPASAPTFLNQTAAVSPVLYVSQSENSIDFESIPVIYENQPVLSFVSDIQEIISLLSDNQPLQKGPPALNLSALPVKSFVVEEPESRFMPDIYPVKNTKRWSIGALASPTYNSRVTTNRNDFSKMLASSEHSLMSYSGGVAVSYKLNKKFTIQTGLYYSSMGQELEKVSSFSGFQQYDDTKGADNFLVLTSSGNVRTSNADVFLIASGPVERIQTAFTNDVFDPKKANLQVINENLLQKFSFLELPLVLRYKFIDKAIDFNLVGGLSYNMLLSNTVYALNDGEKYNVGETAGLNPVSVSSSVGMGMEYSFSEKLSFNIEPTIRYYINPFSNVNGADSHPFSFGLFSGLSYKF
jgi:hypothetical protein